MDLQPRRLLSLRKHVIVPPLFASLGSVLGWGRGRRRAARRSQAEAAAQRPKEGAGEGSSDDPALHCRVLPVGAVRGGRHSRYVWDGRVIRAMDPGELSTHNGRLQKRLMRMREAVVAAFLPARGEVTEDYWGYARWRAGHRLFSSMLQNFATQSLLLAVGVGAQRSLPAAAAINWILKDGLGRLGRLSVAARFGHSFDSDLKRFRFATSLLFSGSIALEYLTPLWPGRFLLMASVANVGKSIGLTTYISTQPSFGKSFARGENLADITAKAQAQQMVMDTAGLLACVALMSAVRARPHAQRLLPLAMLPLLAAGDLWSIWHELKSIHLRSLNRERAEMTAEAWLRDGQVPSAQQVSQEEPLLLPSRVGGGALPLRIAPLETAAADPAGLMRLLERHRGQRYLLAYTARPPGWRSLLQRLPGCDGSGGGLALALREDARPEDVLTGVLQASILRRALAAQPGGGPGEPEGLAHEAGLTPQPAAGASRARLRGPLETREVDAALAASNAAAREQAAKFMAALAAGDWQVGSFMLGASVARCGYFEAGL
ncbi:hypothetical protein WJX81_001250 [Elliptochloris bilobata]|uniref:Protein root UVB sensitive/RUS domain-containing protein n=1 Tax=Elliptochloris bilobata TaxID=381761 RepID=A0AAW1S8U6_9CHLO